MAEKKTQNWKITGIKFLKAAVAVAIAGIAAVYGNNPYYLAIAPLLTAVSNALKHGAGIDLKIV